MHELSIAQSVVAACAERAGGARVTRVTLEIGRLAAVMPNSVRFCFDLCAEGTALQGAALDIVEVAGRAVCRHCGTESALSAPYGRCRCGATDLQLIAGEELRIREMEVI